MEFEVNRTEKIRGVVNAPPSKSYTHRAFNCITCRGIF